LLVIAAAALFAAAQSWIFRLSAGERGLGAFMRDGGGYRGSGFMSTKGDQDRAVSGRDPLPWLKLPKLDFVEVAGQEDDTPDEVVDRERLERLRQKLKSTAQEGRLEDADQIRIELERLMEETGFDFKESP